MTMEPTNSGNPHGVDLSNMHRVGLGKIIERRDLAAAGQDATVEAVARRHASKWRIRDLDWSPTGAAVVAKVNAGRWQGLCPDCGGGEYLNLNEPVFWCCSCANVGNGHQPRPVVFPKPAEAEAGMAVLLRRKGPVLPGGPSPRNWDPEVESVKDLIAQNIERGDTVPTRGGGRQ